MGETSLKRIRRIVLLFAGMLMLAGPIAVATAGNAFARHRMSFTPGSHHGGYGGHRGRSRGASRPSRHARGRTAPARHIATRGGHASDDGNSEGSGAIVSRPGGGFTLEDGVLTYPAPARFQPKNLKHN